MISSLCALVGNQIEQIIPLLTLLERISRKLD